MAPDGFNSYEEHVLRKPLTNGSARKTFKVDMTKPMVAQVGRLGSDYDEWVHQPVKRKECPRLFDSDLLEYFTKCKWWMIPLIWGPVVAWCEAKALAEGLPVKLLLVAFTEGLLFWTLLEYILHRWVFHMKASSATTNKMHYIIHGFHHKHPMDGDRLVFPPLYTAAICLFLWKLLDLVFSPQWKPSFYGGALLGYIIYDLTHYFLHFGTPFTNHLYKMKKGHYNHHFKDGNQNYSFGVTSSFWDRVFGTLQPPPKRTIVPVMRDSRLQENSNKDDNNAE
ncbi:hypothetical protein M758_4G076000 [Ceratodon purpureus]|nr:hypothetical protein M758_4G076000 [Ceratodon purpureus]